jgi:hypothetical protein
MKLRVLVAIVIMLASAGRMRAEVKHPQETKNAALRYWMAFAEMQDASVDKATQELLEKTAAGEAAWDETKLAPILDANADAIRMMQRATNLPECDWGLEYSRGPKASIAYAPRARALARLNTLEGIRQMAHGDSQSAVNTWLAGVRFSQGVARGGTLIFALTAKSALLPNLHLLAETAKEGKMNEEQKRQVYATVAAMPEDGLDWGSAWGLESVVGEQFLQELQTATNPDADYEAFMGAPAPKEGLPPTATELQMYREYMLAVQAALRQPATKAKSLLDGLDANRNRLGEVERSLIPNPQKANAVRTEIATTRAELLQALAAR